MRNVRGPNAFGATAYCIVVMRNFPALLEPAVASVPSGSMLRWRCEHALCENVWRVNFPKRLSRALGAADNRSIQTLIGLINLDRCAAGAYRRRSFEGDRTR